MDMTNASKYAPVPGSIPGTLVNLSGVQLVIAPLNLDQVKALEDQVSQLGVRAKPDGTLRTLSEMMEQSIPLLLCALSRNYPDITEEDLRKIIDLGNFQAASQAVIKVSGYVVGQAGELMPGQQIGMTSTPL